MTDFAAIDFETANECPSSVCSVGVVVVREGEIVDSFYSLIHPEPEYYKWFCRQVHGLGPDDTDDAPVFPFVWEKIEPLIEGLPLVAHNSRLTRAVLRVYSRSIRWIILTMNFSTPLRPHGDISVAPCPTTSSRPSPLPAGTTSRITITLWPMPRHAPPSR